MELTELEAKKLGLRNAADQQNVRADNFVKVYANNVIIGATNWDMSITFGEILGLGENGQPVVEQKVKVNLTREFMKAFSNLLAANVQAYEDKFGDVDFEKIFAITDDMEANAAKKRLSAKKAPARKKR